MFKRILKIVGICLAGFVVLVGGAFGVYALKGGFKEIEINISQLYMDDTTKVDKTIYTLDDFTTSINFEPLDATEKELEVTIQDPMRIVENGNLIQEGILKNVPSTVTAGEEFKIEINKDARGNNYGGVVTLTFNPKGKSIAIFKMKVIVDVAIPNKSLYFAGNDGDSYSTVYGKTITMGISNKEQFVYLKSNLVNAFCLEADNENLKNAEIGYTYITLDGKKCYDASTGEFIEKSSGTWTTADAVVNTFENLKYNRVYNKEEKEYNYYFQVPITPKQSGTITMTAKMHKTHEIEEAYIAGGFDNIEEPNEYNNALLKVDEYNKFINKYIEYFDTTDESYEFFSNPTFMKNGLVTLPYSAIEQSKNFIFQTTTATINITAVNLDSISSTDVAQEFMVFSKESYTIQNMIDKFDLSIKLSEDNVAQISTEKANLFSTLQVSPYIYLEKSEYINSRDTLWENYGEVLGVTGFDDRGKPIVSDESINVDNLDSDEWLGFLVALSEKSAYKEYITSTLRPDAENKVWTLEFNTPLVKSNTETSVKNATKALFLQFQVSGRNLNTYEQIIKNDYTRVYITYNEYDYVDSNEAKISFENTLKRMSINKSVSNASAYDYASELNEQSISISLQNSIKNYNSVQYKRVMYFVEKNSNMVDNGGTKLATIGSYKFRYLNDGIGGASNMVKLFDGEDDLIGERLLNYGTIDEPDYKLYALNASLEPARIFAVVYLSDEKGNPIDVNGRPITIDESVEGGDEPVLVVFAISDITQSGMASVTIDNFVNNINYYTISQVGYSINDTVPDGDGSTDISYTIEANQWVKRNKIDSYVDSETGLAFSTEKLKELQDFLQLKILYNNQITLYATNFELAGDGTISDSDTTSATFLKDVKDFYGNTIKDKAYNINTLQNKQLALNQMASNFNRDYYLNIIATNSTPVQNVRIVRDENDSIIAIQFDIVAEGKQYSTNDYIYIKARDGVANAINVNNNDYVSWEVNKLQVEDIELYDSDGSTLLNTYNKLYANYSSVADDNKQLFGEVLRGNTGGFEFNAYYLYTKDVEKNSIDDNVNFVVKTNLYVNGEVNMALVDMSQANYESNAVNALLSNTNGTLRSASSEIAFDCISDYIEYYTKKANNVKINYKNAVGTAQLKNDLYFPSVTEDGIDYICVGTKKYRIESGNYIIAGGRTYTVIESNDASYYQGRKVVKISSGEYFPMIKESNNAYKVIICDEEFAIEDNSYGSDSVIYNIADTTTGDRKAFTISTTTTINDSTYNPKNYIDDGFTDNTDTALEKTEKDTDRTYITKATVKFLRGGVLKNSSHEDIYVEDSNGKYYYNATTGKYEICMDENYAGPFYSKKGITVYLMITYNFHALNGDGNDVITKVIAYELIQEPITLVATGNVGSVENLVYGTLVLKTQEEGIDKQITINAGENAIFNLNNISSATSIIESNTIGIVGASYEKYFFLHCTFTIDSGNSGIKFINNAGNKVDSITISSLNDTIKIFVPDAYASSKANIIVTYVDETDTIVSKYLRLNIAPNYTFENKSGVTSDSNAKMYKISMDSGEYNISDIISTYFNVNAGDENKIRFTITSGADFAKIESGKLIISKSCADIDSSNRTARDSVIIKMQIVDGSKTVDIGYSLYIEINPTYTIDLRNITGDILYGTNIITSNYITIYENGAIVSNERFNEIIAEIGLKLYKNANDESHLNGRVTYGNMYTTQSNLTFVIKYNEGTDGASVFSKNVNINVIGYETYYSANGEFGDSDSYAEITEDGTAVPTNINFVLKDTDSVNLLNYIRVYTKGNNVNKDIYPVLVRNSSEIIGVTIGNTFGEYKLGYALLNTSSATYTLLAVSDITITIQKLELFYGISSLNGVSYESLSTTPAYQLNSNFTIETNSSTLDMNDYLKFYVGGEIINVIIKDGESAEVTSPITTPSIGESATYSIYYKLSSGSVIDTGYDVTITKIS